MDSTEIRTETHRLGELETAMLRLANEVAELKRECVHTNREMLDAVTRLDTLEVVVAYGGEKRPWWRRWLWFT